jgi:adenylate cyclase
MSFRNKLVAYFLGLLAVVLGASLWAVNRLETRSAEAEVLSNLETTSHVFEEILAGEGRRLATNLKLLSGDFAFKAAVATGDPLTIFSAAVNHRARIGADVLLVTGVDGKILADTRRKARVGRSLKGLEAVRAALEENPGVRVQILDGVPYQIAAVAVSAPDPIGVVAAGFTIDDRLAASLKRLGNSEVSFAMRGRVFASTLPGPAREALSAALPELAPGAPKILALAGERYLTLTVGGRPEITVLLMRSWDRALEPALELQRLLLAIGAAGFAVTVLLGFLIASGVTTSLKQLVKAAQTIAAGRYDIALDIRSRDEIGELGKAFTEMAKGLAEREKIRSILQKAVSKEIAAALLTRGEIELGGEEKIVTVLFSDFRSFTTISESLQPRELLARLNEYFTGMARAIETNHGVIDKYVGDSVMALFGAPLFSTADAKNAVRAALAMASSVDEINALRLESGLPAWRNGIGINTGNVVAGTMGSEDRWSYTVIGDAVNVASRLEGITKSSGARIVVSESTRSAAGPGFAYRPLDWVSVRGHAEPIEIFEVLGEGPAPAWVADFSAGLVAFRARRWADAKSAFLRVLEASPQDAPSMAYLDRLAFHDRTELAKGS